MNIWSINSIDFIPGHKSLIHTHKERDKLHIYQLFYLSLTCACTQLLIFIFILFIFLLFCYIHTYTYTYILLCIITYYIDIYVCMHVCISSINILYSYNYYYVPLIWTRIFLRKFYLYIIYLWYNDVHIYSLN